MTPEGENDHGRLFVISGPSGSGKTTIVRRLICLPGIFYSVSLTSRAPRPGEVEGHDYRFVCREELEKMAAGEELVEQAEVAGNLYGTPRRPLEQALSEGKTVLVDIDVQGAMQIKRAFPRACLVFIKPPDLDTLEKRLRARGTDSAEAIQRRLRLAESEMEYMTDYDVVVENDDLDGAVAQVEALLKGM